MKSLKEIIRGSIIFIIIARVCKLISTTVLKNNELSSEDYKKMSLTIELIILFLALFISYQFI
jgi:hypothetical protein